MFRSPSSLPEKSREKIVESLNARLADGFDLYSQIKVAHWNIKGALFSSLHPLFDTFATSLSTHNDDIAERLVALGGLARGTARQAAGASKLPEYPADTTRDMEHVKHLADRFETYLTGLRETRDLAEKEGDIDTVDMITVISTEFEKHAWFLRASLES